MSEVEPIRAARPDDLDRLRDIEDAAGAAYATVGLPGDLEGLPRALLERGCTEGLLWVVPDSRDVPVAFALCWLRPGALHLREIDVHPSHARRGLGRALIEHVVEECRRRGLPKVSLTTFGAVPWNAPLYRRYGFVELEEAAWPDWMRAIRRAEGEAGLDAWGRVAMVRDVQSVRGSQA